MNPKIHAFLFLLVGFSALSQNTRALAQEEPSFQVVASAVQIALSGKLNDDHIGPERSEKMKSLIRRNPALANRIVSTELEGRTDVTDCYVVNVLELTVADPQSSRAVLRKYIQLLAQELSNAEHIADKGKRDFQKSRITSRMERALFFQKGVEAANKKKEPNHTAEPVSPSRAGSP